MLAVYLAGVSISARNKNYHLSMLISMASMFIHIVSINKTLSESIPKKGCKETAIPQQSEYYQTGSQR